MAKISKSLLKTLLVSSAAAQSFEVFSCNDETLDVSKKKLRYQKVAGLPGSQDHRPLWSHVSGRFVQQWTVLSQIER